MSGFETIDNFLLRLKEYRKALGLDQKKFAAIIGMSQSSLFGSRERKIFADL